MARLAGACRPGQDQGAHRRQVRHRVNVLELLEKLHREPLPPGGRQGRREDLGRAPGDVLEEPGRFPPEAEEVVAPVGRGEDNELGVPQGPDRGLEVLARQEGAVGSKHQDRSSPPGEGLPERVPQAVTQVLPRLWVDLHAPSPGGTQERAQPGRGPSWLPWPGSRPLRAVGFHLRSADSKGGLERIRREGPIKLERPAGPRVPGEPGLHFPEPRFLHKNQEPGRALGSIGRLRLARAGMRGARLAGAPSAC